MRTREAALLVGARMNRPEDIEIDPVSGGVFISLTNNKPGDFHGSILKRKLLELTVFCLHHLKVINKGLPVR